MPDTRAPEGETMTLASPLRPPAATADTAVDLVVYCSETDALPRRLLTTDGEALAGYPNGENRLWYAAPLVLHIAMTGTGAAGGTAVAACNGWQELGDGTEDLRAASSVPEAGRCRRAACRRRWPKRETS